MNSPETSRIHKDRQPQSAQEQLRQLKQDLGTLKQLLGQQRATLRRWAMGLPMGALESLDSAEQRLNVMQSQLMSRQIELRQLRALAEQLARQLPL